MIFELSSNLRIDNFTQNSIKHLVIYYRYNVIIFYMMVQKQQKVTGIRFCPDKLYFLTFKTNKH